MNKIRLIGISGNINSGKSTTANYIVKKYGFTKYSMAQPLKKGVKELFGFSDEQIYTQKGKETIDNTWNITPRSALQYFGTDIMRNNISKLIPNVKDDFWIKSFINFSNKSDTKYVIDDIRFINEIEMVKKLGGIVLRINKSNIIDETVVFGNKSNIIGKHFVFGNKRNDNEIDDIRENVVFDKNNIENGYEKKNNMKKKDNHSSENNLENYSDFDLIIDNNYGIEQLHIEIDKSLSLLVKKRYC